MRIPVPALAISIALAACGDSRPIQPAAATPFVRLAAVPGRPAAGYFQLRIAGDRGALLSVTSPQARRVEMHETMTSGTMSSMRPLRHIAVRRGDILAFTPGGRHLMLFDVDPAIRPGGRIELVLHFERGEPRRLTARIEAAGGEAR
ncbi:MAG TPA: copper chaperone PCu(A)C [Allosphingosinicella sp.]|nr:copper chaperone PCu(A)C [Allosphingosinicella sp.]